MKQNPKTLLFAVVLAACTLTSCNLSGRHKPLMGGTAMAETLQQESEQSTDVTSAEATAAYFSAGNDKLLLPGKLSSTPEQILYREGYVSSYNKATRLPNWVAWHLTSDHTTGPYKRGGIKFQEDPDVPTPRATDQDYYSSGYDRGHMCPAGDNKWSREAQQQSFLFTNICPQAPGLNRGDWNELEQACRLWAKRFGHIYIVAGPILYKQNRSTIGRNKVVVPQAFFKVILCTVGTPKAIGFIYKNTDGNRPKDAYVNTIDEVERITGIDFFPALPDKIEKKVEAEKDLDAWN